ncbi:hypothetical protein [Bradyrhizobium cenepequi]|uniref:hypothetical protein n=1 Tax=Bradyrhizobium cenepequi TaxID=2821403 RepID=UPI001CE2C9D3|nr:hypothetical protein [Bradyrhizobium cenepequi]MCA6111566.1 hypothetical protein [Bradyrhizobium cenepequi]
MSFSLASKLVIITGSSRSIGQTAPAMMSFGAIHRRAPALDFNSPAGHRIEYRSIIPKIGTKVKGRLARR